MDRHVQPLLIGQAPGPNTDPGNPLFPYPPTSTGGRLCELMRLDPDEYLEKFQRTNLLHFFPGHRHRPNRRTRVDHFPKREARIAAQAMQPLLHGRRVVLLGRKVAAAFGLKDLPWHDWEHVRGPDLTYDVACTPHPSGLCRWYNHAGNTAEAREFWASLVRDWT